MFEDKFVKPAEFFQLTPFWTSGKLEGLFEDQQGTWSGSEDPTPLRFPTGLNYGWIHSNSPELSELREGTIENGCVEATFDNKYGVVRLRPNYCDMPKYFLCYRLPNKRENDPEPNNTLGVTTILDDGDDYFYEDDDDESDEEHVHNASEDSDEHESPTISESLESTTTTPPPPPITTEQSLNNSELMPLN